MCLDLEAFYHSHRFRWEFFSNQMKGIEKCLVCVLPHTLFMKDRFSSCSHHFCRCFYIYVDVRIVIYHILMYALYGLKRCDIWYANAIWTIYKWLWCYRCESINDVIRQIFFLFYFLLGIVKYDCEKQDEKQITYKITHLNEICIS